MIRGRVKSLSNKDANSGYFSYGRAPKMPLNEIRPYFSLIVEGGYTAALKEFRIITDRACNGTRKGYHSRWKGCG